MHDLTSFIQQGTDNIALLIPSAIILGILHGLEPGHSKTMMAAFIITIRGTVKQAVALGIAATISHTAIVWIIALIGLHLGSHWNAESTEPYFQIASAFIIFMISLWMILQTWRQHHATLPSHTEHFHHHTCDAEHHGATNEHEVTLDDLASNCQDPHELAHARDIQKRFASRQVTTGQIIIFGLTGGLIPCPAAITVLMLCLQLKKITLGLSLVLCFSIGLAITLVLSGTIAAISIHQATKHWTGFSNIARKAPYFSGLLMLLIALHLGYQGYHTLHG